MTRKEFINKVKATFGGNRQKMDEATRDEFGLTLEQLERAESLWKEAYRASETIVKNKPKENVKSSKGIENNASQEYNGDIKHSLNWHTGLTKNQITELLQDIRYDFNSKENYITDGAKWILSDINGTDVFAIYSTDNAKDPTVLYASKGKKAETERNRLLDILEVEKNVKNANGTSGIVGRVSSGNWMQNAHGMAGGGNGLPGSKSGVGNATVLQGKSSANGSRAFRNVIESLFKISSEGRGGRDGIKHSLKRNGALAKDSENKPITETQQFKRWFGDSKVVNEDGCGKILK